MADDGVGCYFDFYRANLNGEKKHWKVTWF